MNRKRRPVSIEEVLDAYFARSGIKRRMSQASVIAEWAELVGGNIAEVTTPQAVTADGTLFVSVTTAAWMQELQLMSPTILGQLHQRGKRIKRIAWRLG